MAKRVGTGKTSTITRHQPTAHPDLSGYGVDVGQWPRSWMGVDKDLAAGEKIVAYFGPFLEHLAQSNLCRRTVRRHILNLWVLGGEIIRDLNQTPSLRKVPVEQLVLDVIQDGGPLLHHCDGEEDQRSFESTCRKFSRFLRL